MSAVADGEVCGVVDRAEGGAERDAAAMLIAVTVKQLGTFQLQNSQIVPVTFFLSSCVRF